MDIWKQVISAPISLGTITDTIWERILEELTWRYLELPVLIIIFFVQNNFQNNRS